MMKKSLVLLLGISIAACVNPYDVTIKASTGYLVIDGTITNLNEPQHINIARTSSTQSGSSNEFIHTIIMNGTSTPLSNADVKVLVNGIQTIQLAENAKTAGQYDFPANFRGKRGETYQLKIQTNGMNYQSLEETMLSTSPIKKIYDEFNLVGIKEFTTTAVAIPTNDIFIDFDDDPNTQNFYRWTSKVYESQAICETCKQGRYYWYPHQEGIKGDCFTDLSLLATNLFDYPCATPTWDIFYSSDVNIFSDVYTNGKSQIKKLVAQIEFRQANPCLIVLQQSSLTQGAYQYYKLINDQATNNGSLADTPPGRLQGNVKSLSNPQELVLGYFTASAVDEVHYMVNRKNLDKSIKKIYDNLFYFVNNRDPRYESQSFERPQLISAIGVESHTRTIIKPKGWQP